MATQNYRGADECYTAISLLHPSDPMNILAKRSKSREMMRSQEDILEDANEVCILILTPQIMLAT